MATEDGDKVTAELAAIRDRQENVDPHSFVIFDSPRLLAAVEAVLAQHQPGRIQVLGSLCAAHESHRHFSITSIEAADVVACQDCAATVYESCAGCLAATRLDHCPVRAAIAAALLGEELPDA